MKLENRAISLSVDLPVMACDGCEKKFILMDVRDCAEFDVDNLTYIETEAKFCPYCGKKHAE